MRRTQGMIALASGLGLLLWLASPGAEEPEEVTPGSAGKETAARTPPPPESTARRRPAGAGAEAGVPRERSAQFPPEYSRKYPPGSRVPLRLPPVSEGIEVFPGYYVPPLNGVRIEEGIPAAGRDRRLPPPGPVVAKIVDLSGQEWWEHEDGSQTSCSHATVTLPDGSLKTVVSTQHGAVPPAARRGTLEGAGRASSR